MAAVSFSGIASGIDTDSLIQATLDAARATKVKPKETKKTELTDQNDALTTLKSKLSALQDTLQPFRALNGGGIARSVTSSDDSVSTATAASGISNGSYNMTVTQLAEPARILFPDNLATRTSTIDALGSGPGDVTFSFNPPLAVPADSAVIPVTATTTMGEFVSLLNNDSTFASFAEASLVDVGTPISPNYKVVVTAKKTGAGTITLPLAGHPLTVPPSYTDGQNSKITIAGIGTDIERYTNDLTDVITGLTINLKDTGTTKFTVGVDVTATTTRIKDFIEAYNNVIAFLQETNLVQRQETGTTVSNTYGPLAKTSLDENLMTLLKTDIASSRSTSGTSIKILADMGITTDSGAYNAETKTGGATLKLDSDSVSSTLQRTLANALALEPDSVEELLGDLGETVGNVTTGTIAQFIAFNRLVDTAITSNTSQISDLNSRIADAEKSLSNQEAALKQRYARLESLMGSLQSKGNTLSSALAGLG